MMRLISEKIQKKPDIKGRNTHSRQQNGFIIQPNLDYNKTLLKQPIKFQLVIYMSF